MAKKRIGLIVPSSNTVMETDFYKNLPEDITLHTARMYLYDTTSTGESHMLDDYFPRALSDLATVNPDVVVFGCTSAGALRGNEYDTELCKRIEKEASCKSVSVINSASQALIENKIHRIAVVTPYNEELNARIKASFVADGIEVVGIWGLGIEHNFSIASVEPEEIVEFACEKLQGLDIEGAFISCTNFHAMDAREEVQRRLGIPVFTSNQVAYSAALKAVGC